MSHAPNEIIPFSKKISNDIIKNIKDNEAVMVNTLPHYYEYFSNKNVIQFPYYTNEKQFFDIVKQYNVKYIIYFDKYENKIPHVIPASKIIVKSSYRVDGGKVFEVISA